MPLSLTVENLESVAEEHRSLYQKGADEKFHLMVEGLDGLKSALVKEREARTALEKDLKRFEGVDPEKYREAVKKLQDLDDKHLLDAGKIEELVNKRTERMRADYEERLKKAETFMSEAQATIGELQKKLGKAVVERGVLDAIAEVGQPRKEALTDILQRATGIWQINEQGDPVALNPDGSPIYGADGLKPISMKDWAGGLLKAAPHLFLDSTGGGADNQGGNKGPLPKDFQSLPPAERVKLGRQQGKI